MNNTEEQPLYWGIITNQNNVTYETVDGDHVPVNQVHPNEEEARKIAKALGGSVHPVQFTKWIRGNTNDTV